MAALPPRVGTGLTEIAHVVSRPSSVKTTTMGAMAAYNLAYQTCPIILVGGIVGGQGGMAPITQYLPPNADGSPAATFMPVAGGTMISQSVSMFPFANQSVAANATIQQPLTISLLMVAPVNQPGGMRAKLPTFSALQSALINHNALGGTYIVVTPACIYYNTLMTNMVDVTAEGTQKQIEFQIDFIQPLITKQAAQGAQSALLQKISNGQKIGTPAWSGQQPSSPANLPGVVGALANVETALETLGGSLSP